MPSFAKITALPPTKHARHERKQLECGSVNPEWKPRPSGKRLPKPDTKFFVAWDGEGIDTGATIPVPNGKGEAAEHILTLLACSDRKTARHLSRDKQRLTSLELLDFIGECVQHYGKDAIHVSFFFTYDASHIMRDIPRDEVRKAYTGQDKKIGHFCRYGPYLIKYIPRKKLTVERLRDNERETFCDKNGKWHRNVEWRATIWDVHGFFQGSFEKALKEWSIGTAEQLAIIAKGKAERD